MPDSNRWEARFRRIILWVQWLALEVGVFVAFVRFRDSPLAFVAAAFASSYVLAMTVIPPELLRRPLVREVAALAGSVLTLSAVAASGGIESPYLLLSLTPILFAAALGGLRIGLATAALSAGLLTAMSLPEPVVPWNTVTDWIGLYAIVALVFNQARRVLIEEEARARALEAESADSSARLQRLENANRLLSRLSEMAQGAELNPMTAGAAALESLESILPVRAAVVALAGEQGPVVVVRRGTQDEDLLRTMVPLTVGDREVGLVVLLTDEAPSAEQLGSVETALEPLSLAFSNILLLQDIAGAAVREERVRLARELHDEIGPSLASLGLALDVALLRRPAEPALAGHLQQLRTSVGGLVEEIRATVSDLRHPNGSSLTESLAGVVAALPDGGPEVSLRLVELRPPRPSIVADVASIVAEALRNAHRHSAASHVYVEGEVDFDEGTVRVRDDGRGFERSRVPAGHFGLLGMDERAARIGARLDVGPAGGGGTVVTLSWGSQ